MPSFYILDVGHGNCAVLIDREGVVVIDAGPNTVLLDFLIEHHINTVDILLLSHSDADHIAGAIGLLISEEIVVKQVYVNSDSTKNSQLWNDLVYMLSVAHQENRLYFEPSLTPHLNGKLDQGDIAIEILAPSQYIAARGPGSQDRQGRKLSSNSIIAVIRLSYHGKSFALLPGDLDLVGLENLLEDHADIQTWLTVYPHHGGRPGTGNVKAFTKRFCEAVKAEWVIFSIGDNAERFPSKEIIETVVENLDQVKMLSTRSSKMLEQHIEKTGSKLHQNGVGHIHLKFENERVIINGMIDKQIC